MSIGHTWTVTLTYQQVKTILEMMEGDSAKDEEITISSENRGHSGAGVYAHYTEYPDEGSVFIKAE